VAIVDDDPAVLDALQTVFELEGFVVLTYRSGDAFLASETQSPPDCILLDVHLPVGSVGSGLEVLAALAKRDCQAPILMISGRSNIPMAVAAIKAGAQDFLLKPFAAEVIVDRVRETVRTFRARKSPVSDRFPGSETLSVREGEVLRELAVGLSNKETARNLGISPRTVEVHRARIMEKVGARNTADLMRIAMGGGERLPGAQF
jgi:FixJ family two-component response regulator